MEMMAAAPIMTSIMGGLQVASTVMQAVSAKQAGKAQQEQANFEAAQMEQNANNAQAAAEQKVIQQNKETAYVQSNLQAAAAGGGGSATDPTVVTDMKTIAGEGRFRALSDMYEGDAQAQSLRTQAAATRVGGARAAQAGTINAISKVVSGASSLYDKYGSVSSTPAAAAQPMQLPWQRPDFVNS